MKGFTLFSLLICFGTGLFAQKFYVEPLDSGDEKHLKEKIKFEGYNLTSHKNEADYLISFEIDKAKTGGWSFSAYQGQVSISDTLGNVVSRTDWVKKGTYIHNGYNAENAILKEIAKKHLTETIQQALKTTASK